MPQLLTLSQLGRNFQNYSESLPHHNFKTELGTCGLDFERKQTIKSSCRHLYCHISNIHILKPELKHHLPFSFTTDFSLINQSRQSAAIQQLMPVQNNYSNPWKQDTQISLRSICLTCWVLL